MMNFFENENFAKSARTKIWTSKIIPDLWLDAVYGPMKKIKITPPYPTVMTIMLNLLGETFHLRVQSNKIFNLQFLSI